MKKENIALIIFLVLVLGIAWCVYYSFTKTQKVAQTNPPVIPTELGKVVTNPPAPEQLGVIDEHLTINNELRDVNFCGKTYKVKQVLIDGVDVVQRVAELATKDLIPASFSQGPYAKEGKPLILGEGKVAKEICENANPNVPSEVITIKWMQKIISKESGLENESWVYPLMVDDNLFYVAVLSGSIYMTDGFSGTPMGPIGKLK